MNPEDHEILFGDENSQGEDIPKAAVGQPLSPAPPQSGQQVAPIYATQPAQQVVAKNPGLAGFLSFIWTGAGQIYNGQLGLGIGLMALQVVNVFLSFFLIGILTGFLTSVFSIYHAHKYAKDFNAQYGVIS